MSNPRVWILKEAVDNLLPTFEPREERVGRDEQLVLDAVVCLRLAKQCHERSSERDVADIPTSSCHCLVSGDGGVDVGE